MRGLPRRAYTLHFKHEAVQRAAQDGQYATARALGLPEQTLRNWIQAEREGRLSQGPAVSLEQMELSRLNAEQARPQQGLRQRRLLRGPGESLQVPPLSQGRH